MTDGRGTTVTNEAAPPEDSGASRLANRTSAAMRAALGQAPARRPMPFPAEPDSGPEPDADIAAAAATEVTAEAVPEMAADVAPEAEPDQTPEVAADTAPVNDPAPRRVRAAKHSRRRTRTLAVVAWCVVGLLVAGLVAVNVLLRMSNSDTASTDRAGSAAISAATTRIPVILSYSYKTLDSDIATALSNVTGSFKNDYQSLLQSAVAPVATQKQITTKATVVGTGLVVSHKNSAIVLVFVNQSTTSTASKTPQLDGSRIRVGLTKVHGQWLVSSLSPV